MDDKAFKPFEDDVTCVAAGDITIENGKDEIAFYGSTTFQREPEEAERAEYLAGILLQIARAIRS